MARNVVLGALLAMLTVFLGARATPQNQPAQPAAGSVPIAATVPPDAVGERVMNLEGRPDPLEPFNHSMLTFNRKLDDWYYIRSLAGTQRSFLNQRGRA